MNVFIFITIGSLLFSTEFQNYIVELRNFIRRLAKFTTSLSFQHTKRSQIVIDVFPPTPEMTSSEQHRGCLEEAGAAHPSRASELTQGMCAVSFCDSVLLGVCYMLIASVSVLSAFSVLFFVRRFSLIWDFGMDTFAALPARLFVPMLSDLVLFCIFLFFSYYTWKLVICGQCINLE